MLATFIPCYNCANQVKRLIKNPDLKALAKHTNLYFIDNKSTDNTIESIKSSLSNENIQATIIQNSCNYGLGGSFKIAYLFCLNNNINRILWLHGDDQACPKDALDFIEVIHTNPQLEAIFGARFHPNSTLEGYQMTRKIGNICLNIIASLLLKTKISELGSGLNFYDLRSLNYSEVIKWPHHMAFDIRVLKHYLKRNYQFKPIKWREEDQRSNASNLLVTMQIIFELLASKPNHNLNKFEFEVICIAKPI